MGPLLGAPFSSGWLVVGWDIAWVIDDFLCCAVGLVFEFGDTGLVAGDEAGVCAAGFVVIGDGGTAVFATGFSSDFALDSTRCFNPFI